MTKEVINLLNACLPEADDVKTFYASAEQQVKEDSKKLAASDPIECIFSCDACPDFNCVYNLTN